MNRALTLVASALLLAGTGCSQPLDPATSSGPTTPKVFLSEERSASASTVPDFDNAVAFVRGVYTEDFEAIGQYVADDSVAARYVAQQLAYNEVEENNGTAEAPDPDDIDVHGDAAADTVTIEDRSTDPTTNVVWQSFEFSNGKIIIWEVKGKPSLDKRLWHSKASDSSKGVKATLVSAYEGNGDAVRIVVDLSSKDRAAMVSDATYTPKGGYRRKDSASQYVEIDKDGKVLTYFDFAKAKLGGALKIEIADGDGYA